MKNARRHVWIGTICLLGVLCAGAGIIGAQQTAPQESSPAAAAPPTDAAPDSQDPRYRLNVNVELVNVTATVRDEQGRYMDGLKLEDFQVFEDGEEQKISFFSHDLRVPISVGVLIDSSGKWRSQQRSSQQSEIHAGSST